MPRLMPDPSRMLELSVNTLEDRNIALRKVGRPLSCPDEVLVQVVAVSVDRREAQEISQSGTDHAHRVSDFAGVVEAAAYVGPGPQPGARVVGLVEGNSWCQWVSVPADLLAEIPTEVSFTQAATLPVSGLTALAALNRVGLLLGKRVLITDATEGIGLIAAQLAHLSGASVTAAIGIADHEALLEEYGARHVIVGPLPETAPFGMYDMVLATAAHTELNSALALLSDGGHCVLHGEPNGPAPINQQLLASKNITLHALRLSQELRRQPPSEPLRRLLDMVRDNSLQPHVEFEANWSDFSSVLQRLRDPRCVGCAALRIEAVGDLN